MSETPDNDSEQDMVLVDGSTSTMQITIGAILAAVYAVLAIVPMSGFIAVGGVQSLLGFAVVITPLFGIFLGPVRGFVFGLIAGVLATIVLLPIGGGVFLLIPTTILGPALAGLFVGLSLSPKVRLGSFSVPGPLLTGLYIVTIIVLYEIPYNSTWWFMTPYMLAAAVAFLLQLKQIRFDTKRQGIGRYLQLLPFALIGAMVDHSMMSMGSVYLLQLPADLLGYGIFPVMLIERLIIVVVASIVASIILTVFKDASWNPVEYAD